MENKFEARHSKWFDKFTARYARDRRARRGKIRKDITKIWFFSALSANSAVKKTLCLNYNKEEK